MEQPRELVKMSVFAERAGVPIPTIKHYLRERLLPEPVRTGRNMAYYDTSLVPRVKAIKQLQSTMMLPLAVIRHVVDRLDDGDLPDDLALEATVARIVSEATPREALTRTQALAQGLLETDLDALIAADLIEEQDGGSIDDGPTFRDDDVAIIRLVLQLRRAGLTAEHVPIDALRGYVVALRRVVELELELFRGAVSDAADQELVARTEAAAIFSERLVAVLRRKLVLPSLRARRAETEPTRCPALEDPAYSIDG